MFNLVPAQNLALIANVFFDVDVILHRGIDLWIYQHSSRKAEVCFLIFVGLEERRAICAVELFAYMHMHI